MPFSSSVFLFLLAFLCVRFRFLSVRRWEFPRPAACASNQPFSNADQTLFTYCLAFLLNPERVYGSDIVIFNNLKWLDNL